MGELISGQPNDRQLAFARIPNSSTSNRTLASSCPFPSVDLIRPRPRQALLERATRTRTRPLPESASLHFRQPIWLSAAASLPVRLRGPPSGATPTPPTFALKIDYHMRLQVMKFNPHSSRHRRYRPELPVPTRPTLRAQNGYVKLLSNRSASG